MLRKRIVTALWGIILVVLAVWFDQPLPWFTLLAAVWALLATIEFYRISGASKTLPLAIFGCIWTLAFIIQPHFSDTVTIQLLLTAGIVLSLSILVFLPDKKNTFSSWAWTVGGALYAGFLLSLMVALRLDAGREWLFLALFATFGSDIAAFFIGKAFGKRKLAPQISPGKTWAGAIGGILGAVIISLLFTLNTPLQIPISYGEAIILGVLISFFGQVGDLTESLFKRNFGVKDSGTLMAGHGGVLDRTDSVLFAGAVVYIYFTFFIAQ